MHYLKSTIWRALQVLYLEWMCNDCFERLDGEKAVQSILEDEQFNIRLNNHVLTITAEKDAQIAELVEALDSTVQTLDLVYRDAYMDEGVERIKELLTKHKEGR